MRTAASLFLALLAMTEASGSRSEPAVGNCKEQFRQFSKDMAVVVQCDFHVGTPDGLPVLLPECFHAVSAADRDAISQQAKSDTRRNLNSVGRSQWCSAALKDGHFESGTPKAMADHGKSAPEDDSHRSNIESPVQGFACPNPHPLGELEKSRCVAAADSEVCAFAEKYNFALGQLKKRHPELDSARKEFNRSKAIDFGCFKSLLDHRDANRDLRDTLREAEEAFYGSGR